MTDLPTPDATATRRRPLAHRTPFFYGWALVAVSFIMNMAYLGPAVWAFSVFAVPMSNDLGWSRAMLFSALTARILLSAALSPFIGRLGDTLKRPQLVVAAGGILYAASIAAIGLVDAKWQYFALSLAGSPGMVLQLTVQRAVLSKWFVRKRGRAITTSAMGWSMAAFVYPVFTQLVIASFGWRAAWGVMGLTSFVLLVPVAFLLIRQPEDVGLLPDGDTPEQVEARKKMPGTQGGAEHEYSYTPIEMLRSRVVWLLVVVTMLAQPTVQGLATTWVSRFRDVGISAGAAATAVTIYGLSSLISRFFWGILVERYHIRVVLIGQMVGMVLTIIFLLNVRSAPVAIVYGIVQGMAFSGWTSLHPLIYPTYFGRRHIGAIQGILAPPSSVAEAAGPLFVAWMFGFTGAYDKAYIVLMAFWAVAAVLMFLAKPPPRPVAAQVAVRT